MLGRVTYVIFAAERKSCLRGLRTRLEVARKAIGEPCRVFDLHDPAPAPGAKAFPAAVAWSAPSRTTGGWHMGIWFTASRHYTAFIRGGGGAGSARAVCAGVAFRRSMAQSRPKWNPAHGRLEKL